MKRAFVLLSILCLLVCGLQGYKLLRNNNTTPNPFKGKLSDIADEVIAIPLRDTGELRIKSPQNIRQEGNNLFLVSEGVLYRFNREGQFICQITQPDEIQVAGYVINPAKKELIVLGNTDDIFYYSFEGKLLLKKKLKSNLSEERHLYSIEWHDNQLLTTEKRIDTTQTRPIVTQEIATYDTLFRPIERKRLAAFDLRRDGQPLIHWDPLIGIEKDSGLLYAYSPHASARHLLRDTLLIQKAKELHDSALFGQDDTYPQLPLRMGSRYWIASFNQVPNNDKDYLFCYDTRQGHHWELKEGFTDNFYQTGHVKSLEPIDPYGETYYYYKQGEAIKKAFPDQATQESPIVLFLVKLRS